MKWRKLGLVYAPGGEEEWAMSHAYLPTADVRPDGRIRVYFAALDAHRMGRIAYVDVNANDPTKVVAVAPHPVLDLGERGTFDDSGVNPSCILDVAGEKRLYYLGWQRGQGVPYNIFAGLAASDADGVAFTRRSRAPILERTNAEPFFRSATTVIPDGNGFRMWYVSTRRWVGEGPMLHPEYVIRTADSYDGVAWHAPDEISIDFASPDEFGFGRPWVLKDKDRYRMWYSIRSRAEPYRIGYAESGDGSVWTRMDETVGIARSSAGWDSEMICFSCVVDAAGQRLMFYNGNRHGATGFGVAVLESE